MTTDPKATMRTIEKRDVFIALPSLSVWFELSYKTRQTRVNGWRGLEKSQIRIFNVIMRHLNTKVKL